MECSLYEIVLPLYKMKLYPQVSLGVGSCLNLSENRYNAMRPCKRLLNGQQRRQCMRRET